MQEMFSDRSANFNAMLENFPKDLPLYVQDVVQKAFIQVDEKGTVAAAMTCKYRFSLSQNRTK